MTEGKRRRYGRDYCFPVAGLISVVRPLKIFLATSSAISSVVAAGGEPVAVAGVKTCATI